MSYASRSALGTRHVSHAFAHSWLKFKNINEQKNHEERASEVFGHADSIGTFLMNICRGCKTQIFSNGGIGSKMTKF